MNTFLPTKIQYTIIIILLLALYSGCSDTSGEESLSNIIIAGDQSTVDHYFEFDSQDLGTPIERNENGLNLLLFQRHLDLNEDDTPELFLNYQNTSNDTGYKSYFVSITGSGIFVLGQNEEVLGNSAVAPNLLLAGEMARFSEGTWPVLPPNTYLSFVEQQGTIKTIDINLFPVKESSAYLIFSFFLSTEKRVVGWLHIEQSVNDHQPRLLDVGYRLVN